MARDRRVDALERELGRYRKKVHDQREEIKQLREQLESVYAGSGQLQSATDALLAQTAIAYGIHVEDDDGKSLGFRLHLPLYDIAETLGRYEVTARKSFDGDGYTVGVFPREEEEAQDGVKS
ncbi:MAG: hypothetical protein IJL39_05155 [Clostridia bacterium]|nr:hypothetical protein [Clostridia bacterium]